MANNITISDSRSINGAGIYFTTGNLKLANATIQRNNSTTSGGGLYFSSGNVTITGSDFQDNVSASNGGGIYIADTSQINISSSNFSRNTSSMGGAIDNGSTYSTIDISNSTFSNNTVTIHGGAIGNGIGNLTIANSTFTRNSAPNGGAIMNFTNLVLSGSTLSNNNATYGAGIYAYYSTTTLDNSTIQNNNATFDGGGMYADHGTTTLTNSTIQNNNASWVGGIYAYYSTTTLANSTIQNNNATNGGGGMYADHGTTTLPNSTIQNNNASVGGGIVALYGTTTLTNSTIQNNNATGSGGGIYAYNGTMTLTNSTIQNNNATDYGGGIIAFYGTTTLANSTIQNNNATYGGGMYAEYGTTTLTNSKMLNNNATYGGAMYHNNVTTTLTNSVIQRNTSSFSGGALYLIGSNATTNITNSTLANNTANLSGGAIFQDSGSLGVNQSTVAYNMAVTGGGIYAIGNTGNATVSILQSTIARNSANSGGGITNANASGIFNAYNSIIADNLASTGDSNVDGQISSSVNSLYSTSPLINSNQNSILNSNPLLAVLGYYGGSTPTMPPLPGSPAIGAGTTGANVPTTDQRGFARGGSVDIGSVQTQGFTVSNITGSGQSATVNSNFTNPLGLKVTAVNGIDPIAGGVVAFNTPVTGASGLLISGSNQATIDANGFVSSGIFKANTVAGNYQVTSSANGLTPVQFLLTNLAGAAANLAIYSGNGQSTFMTQAFANPLAVLVTDTYGNPVSGQSVTFSLPGSGASATFTGGLNSAISNASGIASSASLTANNFGGSYSITASAAGLASQSFSLTNTAPTVTAFTVQKGSVGRSFVRYVDLGFNTSATLTGIVASIGTGNPRIRMANTGLDGTQNVNYSLANKIAAIDSVLGLDFGVQGIGGERNAATGDGSYLIEMDLDGNGSFETTRRFFRLLGDVNGDKVVDALDANIVAMNIGAIGANVAADINGDGVVNAADTLLARRQKGRRITI